MLPRFHAIYLGFAFAALALGQNAGDAEFTAAYQALASKDYDAAIGHFRTGLTQKPGSAAIHKDLAYTLLKIGENATARDEFEAALCLNKQDEQAALEYAFLAYETGKPVEARRTFDRLRKTGSPATRKAAEQAFQNIDASLAEGIARWKEAVAHFDSPAAHCELARLAELRDDAPLATEQSQLCGANKPQTSAIQLAADPGPQLPTRAADLWAFFDSAYRIRADVDYLARQWRNAGISVLFVASWHNMEPDSAADEYLAKLIEACHRHAILVYAWLELPYVSEQFWTDHLAWREKTALGQDAQLGWRKLMNLQNPECSRAAAGQIASLLDRFDWDGINLAELSFESQEGAADPARFTPMNDNVRAEFKEIADFDPILLFDAKSPHSGKKDLQTFLAFRAVLASRMQAEWLKNLASSRKAKPYLDVVLTRRDERSGLIIENSSRKTIGVDLSVTDPSAVHQAAQSFPHVALSAASSIDAADLSVAGAYATRARVTNQQAGKMEIDSEEQTRIEWKGLAEVDGAPWPVRNERYLITPAGHHKVAATTGQPPLAIADFNGQIQSVNSSKTEVDIAYQSSTRALVEFDQNVAAIEVDGAPVWKAAGGKAQTWMMLPAGQHLATFTRR